jgi:hypothetical protein
MRVTEREVNGVTVIDVASLPEGEEQRISRIS